MPAPEGRGTTDNRRRHGARSGHMEAFRRALPRPCRGRLLSHPLACLPEGALQIFPFLLPGLPCPWLEPPPSSIVILAQPSRAGMGPMKAAGFCGSTTGKYCSHIRAFV
jgi:hypothetical protein